MIDIQKVEVADLELLRVFSKDTFYEFFAHLNTPENMEAYASVAFTPERVMTELNNPNSHFYFAMQDNEIAGYLKLNLADAQNEFKEADAMEIERIYVSGKYHGKYIGKQLLDFAIRMALNKKFRYVWLGVWEHNDKAMAFYKRNGFEVFDSHVFWLGDDKQIDLLMKKIL